MVEDQRSLGLGDGALDGALDGAALRRHVEAGQPAVDHPDRGAQLTFGALQACEDRRVAGVAVNGFHAGEDTPREDKDKQGIPNPERDNTP